VKYDALSDRELKRYFLAHRDDKEALQAYLDRLGQRQPRVIAHPDDPDFGEKVRAAIQRKLEGGDR